MANTPLTPQEVAQAAKSFKFRKVWTCTGNHPDRPVTLTIRSRQPRSDRPTNFVAFPDGHENAGHSVMPAWALTWDGMAEERGWQTIPDVKCPACVAGMALRDFKAKRREEAVAATARVVR